MKQLFDKNLLQTKNLKRWKNFTIAFWLNLATSIALLWLTSNNVTTITRAFFTCLALICFLEKWLGTINGLAKWLAIFLIPLLITLNWMHHSFSYQILIQISVLITTIWLTRKTN